MVAIQAWSAAWLPPTPEPSTLQERTLLAIQTDSVIDTMYHATAENVNYLGATNLAKVAQQVFNSHGPSGPNTEYVLQLEQALLELDVEDVHISELASALR